MNKTILKELTKILDKMEWAFFSGFAVEAYTNGKRKAGDLDILVSEKDIDKFARILGRSAKHRHFKKDKYTIDDYAFETDFMGQRIEATSGYPKIRMENGTINKIFSKRNALTYNGVKVFVVPIEELVALKATIYRDKDIDDLVLLRKNKVDKEFLLEIIKDLKDEGIIVKRLKKLGYKL